MQIKVNLNYLRKKLNLFKVSETYHVIGSINHTQLDLIFIEEDLARNYCASVPLQIFLKRKFLNPTKYTLIIGEQEIYWY